MAEPHPTPRFGAKQLLERYGLKPKHHFGQNFLADEHLNAKIAELAVNGSDHVVEIGAGFGALTRALLARGARVTAIERDRDLIPVLCAEFRDEIATRRLSVVEADAKTFDYEALLAATPGDWCLTGNLPYQLTGPLLRRTCDLVEQIERAVFLLQLEVTDRMVATAGSEHYGALSVFVQAAYAVHKAFPVRRGAFYPQPNVDSGVVVLTPHSRRIAEESPCFRLLVQTAFQKRRKTLKNAWRGLFDLSSDELEVAAERARIDLSTRGETLTVNDFARMSQELEPR